MTIRKLTILGLAVLMLAATQAIAKTPPKGTGTPRAQFNATILNFPTVVDGVVITREFTVKNVGSADLRIDKIKTG